MRDRSERKYAVKKPFHPTDSVGIDCGEGLTEQSHAKQCDINYILDRYHKTGLIAHAAKHAGRYDDVSALDFQNAMFLVTEAQNMFNSLPANMRKRFGGDPAAFLDFVQDPLNAPEMARMGILKGNDGLDIRGAQIGSPVEPVPTPEA